MRKIQTSLPTYLIDLLLDKDEITNFAISNQNNMCEYKEIENIKLSNGKTIKQVNEEVRKEVERIYLEGWAKGISIPFWDPA